MATKIPTLTYHRVHLDHEITLPDDRGRVPLPVPTADGLPRNSPPPETGSSPWRNQISYQFVSLEKNLSAAKLAGWLSKMRGSTVHTRFPKFKMTSSFNLSGNIHRMGMKRAFHNADFSGMDGTYSLPRSLCRTWKLSWTSFLSRRPTGNR